MWTKSWDTGEKKIPFSDWKKAYNWVEEPQTSPDGEKIAAIVNIDEGEFTVCVNGQSWEPVYDKIWYLRFSPDGRATALVSEMGEWTVAVDGVPWENRYGYVWNTCNSFESFSSFLNKSTIAKHNHKHIIIIILII